MKLSRHDHPGWGWAGLAAFVVIADVTGERTMSEAFQVTSRHPVAGPAVLLGWGVLTAHLFGVIPPQLDPLHRLGCHRKCLHERVRW